MPLTSVVLAVYTMFAHFRTEKRRRYGQEGLAEWRRKFTPGAS